MIFNSPMTEFTWQKKLFYVKRDDLLTPTAYAGNKGRKLNYFINNDLKVKKLIGHGSAQANSLYSLSYLAKEKGLEFTYYAKHISNYLKDAPHGNYALALANGAIIKEDTNFDYNKHLAEDTLVVPEGGRCIQAEEGIYGLALEIMHWLKDAPDANYKVVLPSGTGTTAVFLQKNLPIPVYTCSCVGDDEYLRKQFFELSSNNHPYIMPKPKKYHFGKLYKEFYSLWSKLKDAGIEFDLLYDPVAWICLDLIAKEEQDTTFIYIHQGGVVGNQSMLKRYLYKFNC